MEVYVLDSLLRRVEVIDMFESLIWTERFSSVGDFQLTLKSDRQSRSLLAAGTQLAHNESYRVMTVETVEDITDEDGKAVLKVGGRSLETVLMDRVARDTMANLTTEPTWDLTDTPGNIARTIFDTVCRTAALDPGDIIPFLQPGTIFPEDTIPEPAGIATMQIKPMTVYAAIKEICDIYELGFRLVRNFDMSQLYFDIYTGNDRTTFQTVLTPVIFSADLDNLKNTTSFTSIQQTKNVAYVYSPAGTAVVYAENVDPEVEGFERRVLVVTADDITPDNPDVAAALLQRGQEELSKNRRFSGFDGELSRDSDYKYGIDYDLGDLVELRNKDGGLSSMRVTEQIFSSDAEGDKSYPTLTTQDYVQPGTWLTWPSTKVWHDYDTDYDTVWASLP